MSTPRQLQSLPSMRDQHLVLGFEQRRRRRWPVLLLLLVLLAGGGWWASRGDDAAAAPVADDPSPPPDDAGLALDPGPRPSATADLPDGATPGSVPTEVPTPDEPLVPMATVGELLVHLPSPDVLLVGYHEASLDGALEMRPVGRVESNANTTKFAPPPNDAAGATYHVMSSRGRRFPATSAVDLVMDDGTDVLAPVDGIVTDVRPYQLYGVHDDTRIEIQPTAAPHLRVVMIHVAGVQVRAGDRLVAGVTLLADTPNHFPFASHVDRYLERALPHVHVEVKDPALAEPLPTEVSTEVPSSDAATEG